ncbi:MAG: excinuclease ABC subunit UvrC [Dongiaceae bacterium]
MTTKSFAKKLPPTRLSAGVEVIRGYISLLKEEPGVYRMLNARDEALYIGKAKSLAKRVRAYIQPDKLPHRLRRMIAETIKMEFVSTRSEAEALLLEANLIKELHPKYNVALKDDKSLPYIRLNMEHDFPQLSKHRGSREGKSFYFGPFASAGAVNRTITALERAFLLRNCTDTVFAHRERPCLQYHIKRCSAPCVGYVDKEAYHDQVRQAYGFLKGQDEEIKAELAQKMQSASKNQQYEVAAQYRDRIRALSQILSHQNVHLMKSRDIDVFAIHRNGIKSCVQVFFFRQGSNLGNQPYFLDHGEDEKTGGILSQFIAQFYQNKPIPKEILVSHDLPEDGLLAEALSLQTRKKIEIIHPQRGILKNLIEDALRNAKSALARKTEETVKETEMLALLSQRFGLQAPPRRIEIYDNSHIQGKSALGAMVVFEPGGFNKKAYRKFNIREEEGAAPIAGDDYAMLRQVLSRRFKNIGKEEAGDQPMPDLLLIDGGLGQLNAAKEILADLGLSTLPVIAIAKGPDRNAGRERFFTGGPNALTLPAGDPLLYFLQRLRDEAHRFAIGGHRQRRKLNMTLSSLDQIPGIGPKRKKLLLLHFGSARMIAQAPLADLEKVKGISKELAQSIHRYFSESGPNTSD